MFKDIDYIVYYARLVTCSNMQHIAPILRELHWQLVHYHISTSLDSSSYFQMIILYGARLYFKPMITKYTPSCCLHSGFFWKFLSIPPISTTKFYGDISFTVTSLGIWNSLRANVHSVTNFNHFYRIWKLAFWFWWKEKGVRSWLHVHLWVCVCYAQLDITIYQEGRVWHFSNLDQDAPC